MKKRLTFQCGKCQQKFSFQKELSDEQELIFTCPFCETELLLRLDPFKRKKMDTLRSASHGEEQPAEWEYDFPEVIPAPPTPLSPRERGRR